MAPPSGRWRRLLRLAFLLAALAGSTRAEAPAHLDTAALHAEYLDGDLESLGAKLKPYADADSSLRLPYRIFVWKHLGVIAWTNPEGRARGVQYFRQLLLSDPGADLEGMYVSQEIQQAFARIRTELRPTPVEPAAASPSRPAPDSSASAEVAAAAVAAPSGSQPMPAATPPRPATPAPDTLDWQGPPGPRGSRFLYTFIQTGFTTGLYGLLLPSALGVSEGKTYGQSVLSAFALGLFSHSASLHSRFRESQYAAACYGGKAALLASYGLTFSVSGQEHFYRNATQIAALAYPVGLWSGFRLGSAPDADAGRIELQSSLAQDFGLVFGTLPLLYFERPLSRSRSERTVRWMTAQGLGFALAGHWIGHVYRKGEALPLGIGSGITQHTLLGFGAGLLFASMNHADIDHGNFHDWVGYGLGGAGVGLASGLLFHHDASDTKLQAALKWSGLILGSAIGGLLASSNDADTPLKAITFLVGGEWLGYQLMNLAARTADAGSASAKAQTRFRVEFAALPRQQGMGWRGRWNWPVPGAILRF